MENGQNRLRKAQEDVEEVKVIMLDNLNKADERSTKLGDLEDRADELRQKGEAFSKTSAKVKQKKRWENNKLKVIMAAVIVGVVILIIVIIIMNTIPDSSGNGSSGQRAATSKPPLENSSG
ncbi:vesicle-associated membrane protein 5 [Misgurnus anguillicaudatus]|uniref:vesicle-associated membrane protein 5 n=1 Tax=Misgurnus anguillicaudatus TaxID=75329 RepID=UPI003CCF63F8